MSKKTQKKKNRFEPHLTRRERQCLQATAHGKAASEIALTLGISTRMVREHLRNARIRLGAQSTTQAAVMAERMGLLDPKNLD